MNKRNAISVARRKRRTRQKLRQAAKGRPRLSVFRSLKHIHAQIIDDQKGETLAAASSMDKDIVKEKAPRIARAKKTGLQIAERAKKAGVSAVVFDRGAYLYHGHVKALAEGAREGGLEF